MSFLDVTIRGLAFCRPVAEVVTATHTTPAFTQILFPHPTGHELQLVIKRSDVLKPKIEPVPITKFNTFMTMTLDGGAKPATSHPGGPVENIVNIVDLHNEVSGAQQPTLKFKSPSLTKLSISYLSLPTDTLYSAAPSLDHEIWSRKKKDNINPTRIYLKTLNGTLVSREIVVRFEIPPIGAVPPPAVNLNMTKPFNQLYSFEYEAGINYTVLFDNDCNGQSCGNDFRFYYDMLTATDDKYFDVKIEEIPVTDPGNPDTEAACNPVLGNTGRDLEEWYNQGGNP